MRVGRGAERPVRDSNCLGSLLDYWCGISTCIYIHTLCVCVCVCVHGIYIHTRAHTHTCDKQRRWDISAWRTMERGDGKTKRGTELAFELLSVSLAFRSCVLVPGVWMCVCVRARVCESVREREGARARERESESKRRRKRQRKGEMSTDTTCHELGHSSFIEMSFSLARTKSSA